ncbi:MAG: hypothetical protein RQ715_05795 [Methylococcales bacterium]|nr:hypothetical protein [Methylococcales bacterium]
MRQNPGLWAWLLVGIWLVSPAWGAPKTNDNAAFIRKAQGMIRQLTQEKAALQAEKNAWQQEKAQLEKQLGQLEQTVTELKPLPGEVKRYKSGLEHAHDQLSQEKQRFQTLLNKYNELAGQARKLIDDNELLLNVAQEREQWISTCSQRNRALLDVQQQLIDQYQDKSLWQRLIELEPITGIAHVDTQNQAETYRYQLKSLTMTPYPFNDETSHAAQNAREGF